MGSGGSHEVVHHHHHPPDTSALEARHRQAMEAAERERAALTSQLDALTKQIADTAEAQKKKDAEMAALKAVVDKVGRMLCVTSLRASISSKFSLPGAVH
jgi:chromosome segregation ATPase